MNLIFEKEKYFHHENITIKINIDNICVKPQGYIEGSIIIKPLLKVSIKLKDTKIIFTLTQIEFFDYSSQDLSSQIKPQDIKNQHMEIIFNKETNLDFENNTISSVVKLPVKISIPKHEKLLPTFNLHHQSFASGVRHILTVRIPDINATQSIGLIMSSPNYINIDDLTINNNNITKEEQIYKIGLLNQGTIKYTIKKEKNFYNHDDDIKLEIMIDTKELGSTTIKRVRIILQRKITLFGYTMNSVFRDFLTDKTIEFNKFEKQEENINNSEKEFKLGYTIPKIANNVFNEKEIEQYMKFNEKIFEGKWDEKCLIPTIKGYFFACDYKIKVHIDFDSLLIPSKHINIPVTINLSDDYFNKYQIKDEPEEEKLCGSFIYLSS